jgi:hypothetical protein
VTRSRQRVRRQLLRELDQLGGQPQCPEPKALSSALTTRTKTRETWIRSSSIHAFARPARRTVWDQAPNPSLWNTSPRCIT